ncbi:hypothetical protein I4641_01490 [Waterburya agarophytonicola K14]|uniref:Uncharacterized protein n=1 Tax=Waterburya agarophytonicola KI4 TaxID=2874699 RepID=A0A964BLL9_9CYAN|nr:hypothetical protein [Waterburya agarophytonicola KI4]
MVLRCFCEIYHDRIIISVVPRMAIAFKYWRNKINQEPIRIEITKAIDSSCISN